jgi:hypothetical protein
MAARGVQLIEFGHGLNPGDRISFVAVVERRDLSCDPPQDGV